VVQHDRVSASRLRTTAQLTDIGYKNVLITGIHVCGWAMSTRGRLLGGAKVEARKGRTQLRSAGSDAAPQRLYELRRTRTTRFDDEIFNFDVKGTNHDRKPVKEENLQGDGLGGRRNPHASPRWCPDQLADLSRLPGTGIGPPTEVFLSRSQTAVAG